MSTPKSSTTVNDSHKQPSRSAVQFVDSKLMEVTGRDVVSTSEVTNMLLDIRLFLMGHEVKEQI